VIVKDCGNKSNHPMQKPLLLVMEPHKHATIQNILKPHAQTAKYNRSGIYQMKCLDCPLNIRTSDKQEKHLILDTKNTFTPSEAIAKILDIQTTY
jgi:hypothetical protein